MGTAGTAMGTATSNRGSRTAVPKIQYRGSRGSHDRCGLRTDVRGSDPP